MGAIILGLISAIPGLASKLLEWQVQRANVALEGFKTATGVDLAGYQAYLSTLVEINRMKLAQQSWWGAKLIILLAGVPCSLHLATIMLDSMPTPYLWPGDYWLPYVDFHRIGSWKVPAPPKPYDTYEWAIVQSFFLVMPVQTGINAVSQWLNRR